MSTKVLSASTMLVHFDELPAIKLNGSDDDILRFELDPLSAAGQEVAERELRETPEIKAQAIIELRTLLQVETDLLVPSDNDDWLVRFLRPCKFYASSARDLIKQYYAFKVKHSNVYDGLSPSTVSNIFKHDILVAFKNRDQCGRRIILLELGKRWKHKEVSLDEVFQGCVVFMEAAMLEHDTQVNGSIVIFDMDGLSLQQTWQFTPLFAKRIVDWLQDCVPMRIKAIHIVNQPKIFGIVFNFFKPFLREKLRSRILFHGTDRQSLHNHLSPKCLPPAYGGSSQIPRVHGEQWLALLLKLEPEFEAVNSYGYNRNGVAKKK